MTRPTSIDNQKIWTLLFQNYVDKYTSKEFVERSIKIVSLLSNWPLYFIEDLTIYCQTEVYKPTASEHAVQSMLYDIQGNVNK